MHIFRRLITMALRVGNFKFFIYVIGFVAAFSLLAFWIEKETFGTWFNAVWWTMTTLSTVGYGDVYPKTVPGKLLAMFLFVFGVGVMGLAVGKVIEAMGVYKKRKEEGKLKYRGRGHIILIGATKKSLLAVEELLKESIGLDVVLIDPFMERTDRTHERFHYIKGDSADTEVLQKANIGEAKSVIVFARDENEESDGHALLVASVIEHMAPHVHVVVEIKRRQHFAKIKNPVDEPISSDETVARMLVRSSMYPGVSKLYNQLLSQDGDDLYRIPKHASWRTYRDAFLALLEQGATLIANGSELGINRKLQEVIAEPAELFIICDEPTYKRIVKDFFPSFDSK